MIVLGVANSKDSGVCLIEDGVITAAANEERFTREKLTTAFPEKSLEWLLEFRGLRPKDINAVGIGVWKGISSDTIFPAYIEEAIKRSNNNPLASQKIIDRVKGSLQSDTRQKQELEAGLVKYGLDKIPRLACHHHMAHIYTAFEFSPFDKALAISLDGRGDYSSGCVCICEKGKEARIIREELELDSLGAFYGWITYFLGFTPDRHEGKITGLAPYGDPQKCLPIISKMIGYNDGRIIGNIGNYFAPYVRADLSDLREELKGFKPEDVAAAAQTHLEEIVVSYAQYYLKQTGLRNLCVAGGIFANVSVNMRLREMDEVDHLFVFPHMGDGGSAAGGAVYASNALGDAVKPVNTMYLGPVFDETRIESTLRSAGARILKSEEYAELIAELINKGAVVGLFTGRMEYGPRALGARSVIAKATDPSINRSLNNRLSRTEFMPFAPVTLEEKAAECYQGWTTDDMTSYYMTCCFRCTQKLAEQSPAVVHVNNTARPQIINRSINSVYYDILKVYFDKTGIPTLINTSFNNHEEPIVATPEDAISVLAKGGIDILAMPPFIGCVDSGWLDILKDIR